LAQEALEPSVLAEAQATPNPLDPSNSLGVERAGLGSLSGDLTSGDVPASAFDVVERGVGSPPLRRF
jgi:hypothetical protein